MTKTYLSMIRVNDHNLAAAETKVYPNNRKIVIFCHGFRSSSIGPNRFFMRAAAKLAEQGIDSLRFDQYGSGNSEGDFMESSFNDWIDSTIYIANKFLRDGYEVSLFGQSMGGATVIAAGTKLKKISSVVAWAPDPSIDEYEGTRGGFHEEGGERVREGFWREAHKADIPRALRGLIAPAYIIQCGKDEYVSAENHQAISKNARKNHVVEMFSIYPHSAWTFDQATVIIDKSVSFIVDNFKTSPITSLQPTHHLKRAASLVSELHTKGVSTVLYGSTGVSYYLGNFKSKFGDVDLLVDDVWLAGKWHKLENIMKEIGYHLVDEHEHEFSHPIYPDVAFAAKSILIRDKVVDSLDELVSVDIDGFPILTLSAKSFLEAYKFSIKDGYRIEHGRKDDAAVIDLLNAYLGR